MEISENKVVSLIYELRKESKNGDIVESLTKSNPLTFLYGKGNLLEKFEKNIQGLTKGDKFSFSLSCEEAYGPIENSAIVDVPIQAFEVDGKIDYDILKTGSSIPMMDSNNRRLVGVIREIYDDKVKMDFNHPMAGVDLFFKGEITAIREASEDEIIHGHVHSEHDCHGCNHDGCDNCG